MMKNQEHNKGELKELKVKIESKVVDSVERMAANQGIPVDELVVIALKRYKATHSDLDVPPKK
jgi:hypothetical protein